MRYREREDRIMSLINQLPKTILELSKETGPVTLLNNLLNLEKAIVEIESLIYFDPSCYNTKDFTPADNSYAEIRKLYETKLFNIYTTHLGGGA